eukprot:CAMPEP_0116140902 /NCGR_PEP_ID=MMETSP0329-20121206/14100_1 /TAXON_ID=697910 /ORGANISM="Pseudo-nitzschia arenysensis, Strain B593" /LENGTH=437 /DNA_ID=CAMNT_0003636057 /DNA_START=363 /DNA_END=1674 /DNA_ORIENTATION=+
MSSLRSYLQQIDGSAPAIQGAAGAMMKHYDRSAGVAVGEWRNALIQAQDHQYLPLLYVANEVLQTSKRNRGNKFLEAFSPILGQSLIFVCSKSGVPTVDRVRRTVKIWAERRVFSIRYVNELIKGLEPYRRGGNHRPAPPPQAANGGNESPGGSRFSPVIEPPREDEDGDTNMFGDDDDDKNNNDTKPQDNDSSDDDDDDLFGNASNNLLKIDMDFDKAASGLTGSAKKRRRSEDLLVTTKSIKSKRTTVHLSASSLLELMNQVATQQQKFERAMNKLATLKELYQAKIDSLVGNELLEEYKRTLKHEQEIHQCRLDLHTIAQTRKSLEQEALRYLPWLERALKQDQEDVEFSKKFRKQLELFKHVHKPTKEARDRRLQTEARRAQEEEERLQKQQEEEDRKKFEKSALSKQTEAMPGMVWNKATQEYQYPNQEESW